MYIIADGSTAILEEHSLGGLNTSSFMQNLTKINLDRNVNINYNSCQ